jgi:hypothetical protein
MSVKQRTVMSTVQPSDDEGICGSLTEENQALGEISFPVTKHTDCPGTEPGS